MLDIIETVIKLHDGQRRKGTGEPFVCHPIRVAKMVEECQCSPEAVAAALFHDVVEDCFGGNMALLAPHIPERFCPGHPRTRSNGFEEIMRMVDVLTLRPDEEKMTRLLKLKDPHVPAEAVIIKMADMIDNNRGHPSEVKLFNQPRAKELYRVFLHRNLLHEETTWELAGLFLEVFEFKEEELEDE